MLIDSHAHLDSSQFKEDLDEVMKKIEESGVELVINPAANMSSSRKIVELVKKYTLLYGAVGVHPHDTTDMKEKDLSEIKELAKKEKIVAIGEIGLDYYYDHSPRDIQKKMFIEQIKIAKELKLPIIVHEREAAKDVYDIIREENTEELKGVIHCFSGSLEMALEYIKLGFYISFGGPVTFKNAKKAKLVVSEAPIENILVETDSPYLTPTPYRGKRNDSTYLKYIVEEISKLKNMDYDTISEITNKNTKKLFNI